WGFGHTFFAFDLKTRQVLWTHNEQDPVDTRAVCMKNGRIFYYSHPNFLACLDARQGKPVWRTSDAKLLEAIGPHFRAQTWQWGFSSTSYVKCSDRAIYFAGPQRPRLVAASAEDGRLLWQYEEGNFQLVLHNGALYAMGSRQHASKKFDPMTGEVLAELDCRRAACTRATGTVDSILCRAGRTEPSFHAGSLRLMTADDHAMRLPLMRPPCQDGVIIANGLLHWGPWMCDCNLSLVGNLCLGPAGEFEFETEATEAERLESAPDAGGPVAPLAVAPGDWPTYRADNQRSAASPTDVPTKVKLAWQYEPPLPTLPAAPVTAGGLAFLTGADGVVRAVDAATGRCRWKGYTSGRIYYPPAVDQGRLLVGSGDGRVYAFEAATGRTLWTFRAAPAERKISLYGRLSSTWPVAGGVLAEGGVVYAAAGIASWDGTHVYALDAKTGKIHWQNNTSGHLAGGDKVSGVSVQGHLLLHQDRLYLAGGNVVSPAVYDTKDGRCLNTLEDEFVKAPRGSELVLVGGNVTAFGRLLYSPEEYWLGPFRLPYLIQAESGEGIVRTTGAEVFRVDPAMASLPKPKALWVAKHLGHPVALALGKNAAVAAGQLPSADELSEPAYAVAALNLDDSQVLWSRPLPAMPLSSGLALDSAGRTTVALRDGRVLCFQAAD
ncbi:MAG: PQQ-binding-like beta-propeller repeat protein, partial [Planctomycetota bacterium]